jgi:hypothetical protein
MIPGQPRMIPEAPRMVPGQPRMIPEAPRMVLGQPRMVPEAPRMVAEAPKMDAAATNYFALLPASAGLPSEFSLPLTLKFLRLFHSPPCQKARSRISRGL